MPSANLQLIYVTDIARSTELYTRLFDAEPVFSSPRYVAFASGAGTLFALWSGGEAPDAAAPRFAEIGIMLEKGEAVDALFDRWQHVPGLRVVRAPYTDVFGRTFLVADPDGHVIRVCPLD